MRLFPGKIPNVSRRRSSIALLVGTAFAIGLLSLGKEWHPPVYPVQDMPPLTPESRKELLWAAYGTRIPETIVREDVAHFAPFEANNTWLKTLQLPPAEAQSLAEKYAHTEVDPLLPALHALEQRIQVLGIASDTFRDAIQKYLMTYPSPMEHPNCAARSNNDFDQFVCLNYQATLRNTARTLFFQTWLKRESDRHQFGRLFEWARLRTQKPKRTAQVLYESPEPSVFSSVEEVKDLIVPQDYKSAVAHAVSSFSSGHSLVESVQKQLRPYAPFIEDWMYPQVTLSCGTTASTAHVQVAPLSHKDPHVHPMCLHELQRRQQAEVELQEIYSEIVQLRDTALHNKNLLQISAWLHQRKTLRTIRSLLARVLALEQDALPAHSLWTIHDAASTDWTTSINTLTAHLDTGDAETLIAFVSQPKANTSNHDLNVRRSTAATTGHTVWALLQDGEPVGTIHGKGNVYYLDNAAKKTLGYETPSDPVSRLSEICLVAAQPLQPITWCTAHQWMTLSYTTPQPGRLHQILHNSGPTDGDAVVSHTPLGWMVFWGTTLTHDSHKEPWVVGTGSASITLFEHLNQQPVDPTDSQWPFRSVLLDLK